MDQELDFSKIMAGEEQPQQQSNLTIPAHDKKMTKTDTRARQQSCMVSEIDKDLVTPILVQLPSSTKPANPANFRVSLSDMLNIVLPPLN